MTEQKPSRRGGSDEGSQHTVSVRKEENILQIASNTPSYLKV